MDDDVESSSSLDNNNDYSFLISLSLCILILFFPASSSSSSYVCSLFSHFFLSSDSGMMQARLYDDLMEYRHLPFPLVSHDKTWSSQLQHMGWLLLFVPHHHNHHPFTFPFTFLSEKDVEKNQQQNIILLNYKAIKWQECFWYFVRWWWWCSEKGSTRKEKTKRDEKENAGWIEK